MKSDRAELKFSHSKLRRLPASSIGRKTAEAVLNISFSALEKSETIDVEEMISITKAPIELLDLVHKNLCEILNVNDYPTKLTTEIDRSFFVRATLTCITNYVSRKFAIEGLKIVIEHDISIQIPKEGIAVRTKIDQIIILREGDGNNNYIVVVECKRWNVDDGLEQCCVGMKACFEANKDDHTVYGFCTVAERWNFLTYDKLNGFKMMAAIDVMFAQMVSKKQIWLEKYTKIIDIIYTCLLNVTEKRVQTKHICNRT